MYLFRLLFKIVGIVLVAALVIAIAGVGYLTMSEYRPDDIERIETGGGTDTFTLGDSLTIMTFNTGYAGLDKSADFFMDGGEAVNPESEELVKANIEGISQTLADNPADIYLLQEVDINSSRSYKTNQFSSYKSAVSLAGSFAYNYNCSFVPYPIPFIGHVESGIATLTDLFVSEADRVSLPSSFSWPVSTCNLKRCLITSRIPIEGSEHELVIINLHLDAYDDGEGKQQQMDALCELMAAEYLKGNYVIAGGDFNQNFPEANAAYPIKYASLWTPGELTDGSLPASFSFVTDTAKPSCRLLNEPYDAATAQFFVIDGFIVSDNVLVDNCQTLNTGFEYSDHQPVMLTATIK